MIKRMMVRRLLDAFESSVIIKGDNLMSNDEVNLFVKFHLFPGNGDLVINIHIEKLITVSSVWE